MEMWCREHHMDRKDRTHHEPVTLTEVIMLGGAYNQLNMPSLMSFEKVNLRLQLIVETHAEVKMARHYNGVSALTGEPRCRSRKRTRSRRTRRCKGQPRSREPGCPNSTSTEDGREQGPARGQVRLRSGRLLASRGCRDLFPVPPSQLAEEEGVQMLRDSVETMQNLIDSGFSLYPIIKRERGKYVGFIELLRSRHLARFGTWRREEITPFFVWQIGRKMMRMILDC